MSARLLYILFLLLLVTIPLCGPIAIAQETEHTIEDEVDTLQVPLDEEVGKTDSTVFDLFLSEQFSGAVVTTFTDDWCELDDPTDAVSQLSGLQGKTERMIELFSGRIERSKTIEGLGTLTCNPSTFRIVLVPDPTFLKASALNLGQRVGKPDSGFSANQTLGVALFRDESAENTSSFSHRGLMSYEDVFLRTNGFLNQGDSYQFNEATLGTIIDDFEARAGLLQMRAQPFTPSLRFAGMQFETAEDLFLDNDAARGSKLEIYVPSRSTVRFYREGQLLAVKVLDFGLQEVETSSFPQGSYDIDIIITDSSGQETQERRFYTKAGFLTSRTRPVFFLSGGAVRTTFEVLDTPIVQGGMRVRASDFFDIGLASAATDENSMASLNINGLYDIARVGLGGAVSPGGQHGAQGSLGLTLLGASVTGQVSRVDGEDRPNRQDTDPNVPVPPAFVPQQAAVPVDLYLQTLRSTSLNVSRAFGPLTMRYNIQRNKVGDSDTRYAAGPIADLTLLSTSDDQVVLRGSDLTTNDRQARSVQLFYRHRVSSEWNLNSQLMQRWQDEQDETMFLLGATYNSQSSPFLPGSRVQILEEARRQKQAGEDIDSLSTNVNANSTSDYVRAAGFVRDVRRPGEDGDTGLGLTAQSAFLVSNEGQIDVAYPPQNDSVFVAEVKGNALTPNDEFEVRVNGQTRGTISLGERAIISLPPYRTYKIDIVTKQGSGLVDYDTTIHEVTLFPGNVAKRVWHIDKVFVLLGRVLDEEGNPIPGERIRGAKGYAFTESDGTFQAEVTGAEELSIESKRHKCTLQVSPPETTPEYFFDLGDVTCTASPLMPESEHAD